MSIFPLFDSFKQTYQQSEGFNAFLGLNMESNGPIFTQPVTSPTVSARQSALTIQSSVTTISKQKTQIIQCER